MYLIICILMYFLIRITNLLIINIFLKTFIYFILFISNYIGAFYLINKCYFYENYFMVIHCCRFFSRRQIFSYKQITRFKYISTVSRNSQPTIFLNLNKGRYSFPLRSFKKRKTLFNFLRNRGVEIEIDSIFEKDYQI